jgi:membrane protease subunit (stomatin/prohibitin family)
MHEIYLPVFFQIVNPKRHYVSVYCIPAHNITNYNQLIQNLKNNKSQISIKDIEEDFSPLLLHKTL